MVGEQTANSYTGFSSLSVQPTGERRLATSSDQRLFVITREGRRANTYFIVAEISLFLSSCLSIFTVRPQVEIPRKRK